LSLCFYIKKPQQNDCDFLICFKFILIEKIPTVST